MTVATLNRLMRNDCSSVHCNVNARDKVSSDLKRGFQNLDVVRHTSRLRWLGWVDRSTG